MRSTLVTDVAIAALLAVVVLILVPGLAVASMIAIFVAIVCLVSFLLEGLRSRR